MNPITTAVSCTLLRSPLASPVAPRKSSWNAPASCQLSKGLAVPSSNGGRRGSHDKRIMFAYPDQKEKKKVKSEAKKKQKLTFETEHKVAKNREEKHEPKKKRLRDVATEVQHKKKTKKKDCVTM